MKRILFLLLLIQTAYGQSVDGTFKTLTATMPTTDNYVLTEALPASYDAKEKFIVVFPFANTTTTPTINRNGLGTKFIKNEDGTNPAIGSICACRKILSYNGTYFQIIGSAGGGGGSGTVTSVSVATANGFSGSVANATTTPAITLTLQNATTGQSGQLTSTDWNTFNGKQSALGFTPANQIRTISTTAPLTGGGNLSADRTFAITQATTGSDGYLSSTDWNAFNNKVSTTRTISTTSPITGGGDLSANRTLAINQATTGADGYLSSTDWNTFNAKQSPLTLVANATDANFTATANGVHNILDGVASANRVITIPVGANGNIMKFYNTEDTRVWSFTGATVYLADRVTVVTELLYNVPCLMEKIDGLWIITN